MKKGEVQGITLVEILISMTLGMILTTACLQVFLTFKQVFMTQQAFSRIQENARIISLLLGEYIQSSGNIGCSAFREDISFFIPWQIDRHYFGLYPDQRIRGISLNELKNLVAGSSFLKRINEDSDILWVKTIKKRYSLAKPSEASKEFLFVKGRLPLKENQIISLSDCSHVDFLQSKENIESSARGKEHKIRVLPLDTLSKEYSQGAKVGVLSSILFYVGKTGRKNATGIPISALYSTDLNSRTLELVEGVEAFEVKYGLNLKQGIIYVSYHQVNSWKEVVSIRVSALLTSIEDGLREPKAYQLQSKKIIPTDRLMRMWWTFEWAIKGLT